MRQQRHWAGSDLGTGRLAVRGQRPSPQARQSRGQQISPCNLRPHRPSLSRPIGDETSSVRLAIPAMAIPADALVWVEGRRTSAEVIPMISGHAEPVATSVGRRRRQGYGRQRRHGGGQQSELTHLSSPILGLVGHVTWNPSQIRHLRASPAVSESTHGRRLGGAPACLLVDPAPARSPQIPAQIGNGLAFLAIQSRRRTLSRSPAAGPPTLSLRPAGRCAALQSAVPTSLVPR